MIQPRVDAVQTLSDCIFESVRLAPDSSMRLLNISNALPIHITFTTSAAVATTTPHEAETMATTMFVSTPYYYYRRLLHICRFRLFLRPPPCDLRSPPTW
jgi:hypothetical protein